MFRVNPECPRCGLKIEHGEGFFLGSMSLNYGFTLVCYLTPILILAYKGVIGKDGRRRTRGSAGPAASPSSSTVRPGAGGL